MSFNRFFTKTKVEITSSDDNEPGLHDENRRQPEAVQQVIRKSGSNHRILGENIIQSPIDDRKGYNSKSTLKTSLKQTTPTPQTDDGVVYGSPRNAYSFF